MTTTKRPGFTLADGATVAPMALGAMIMGTRTPEEDATKILDHFVGEIASKFDGAKAMIDTADCYCWWNVQGEPGGHSEAVLARWFEASGKRDDVYLATKGTATISDLDQAWGDDGNPNWEIASKLFVGASPEALDSSLAGSLERLKQDAVDLYYIHVDDRSVPLEKTLATLAAFVDQGKIGAYGWSNVPTWRLAQIEVLCEQNGWPKPVAVQQQHSYLRPRPSHASNSIVSHEQLDYLSETPDLTLVAYSPVAQGLFADLDRRKDHWMMDRFQHEDSIERFAAVDAMAKTTGATANQVVLAWMMAQESPRVLPLIGARTWDQYLESVEAVDVTLTADQVAELSDAGV